MSLIVSSIGLVLYNIAAIMDGLFLPLLVTHEVVEATGSAKETWGILATYTHEFAITFAGLGFAHVLFGTGLLGLGLNKLDGFKTFGIVGMVIGAFALVGYLTGILDLMITGSFELTGGLTLLTFTYFFVLGIKVLRLER